VRIRRALVSTLFVPAIGLGAVGCSSDDEQPSATTKSTGAPSSEPPWGLNTIDMPDDAQSVQATFEAFPEEIGGVRRAGVSPNEVSYGDGSTFVRAIDLAQAQAEGFPSTAPAYLGLLASSGEVVVEEKETNPNAGFVYLVSMNTAQDSPDAEPRETFDAAWGAAGGGWLFVASANSAEEREALANAFLEAASSEHASDTR
jgi:hypothetical protein